MNATKSTTRGELVNELNKEIDELRLVLRTLLELHKSLIEDEQCDHEVGICWHRDFDAVEWAERLLNNVRD